LDSILNDTKRWVLVAQKVQIVGLLLAKAATNEQSEKLNQIGRVFSILNTDDFEKLSNLLDNKVEIIREPILEAVCK
jgi:hypothetical protein